LNRKIGSGHFSIVRLAKDKRTGIERAVKVIARSEMSQENEKTLTREIEIIRKIQVNYILFIFVFYFCLFLSFFSIQILFLLLKFSKIQLLYSWLWNCKKNKNKKTNEHKHKQSNKYTEQWEENYLMQLFLSENMVNKMQLDL